MSPLENINPNRCLALLLSLLFLLLVPILAQVSTYHSDEHYYTDSAVYMVQHDDYLSPRLNDGTLRTKKPILTYWMIITSYAVFGINLFAARLPFLLAGCITVWLTYKIALQLFKRTQVALLAAVILASNIQFLMLCLRATPDMLQVLFMNLSLWGYIAITFTEDGRLRNYLFLYGGAALVVQTKGLLGVVLIIFIFAHYLIRRYKTTPTLSITHWPVMTMAAMVALSWYAYIFIQHGSGTLLGFYTDQVGGKISGSKLYMLANVRDYLWGVFRNFFPWSFVLAAGYIGQRKAIHDAIKQHRQSVAFILSWFGLLFAIFIASSDCRTRYLVPAYPLMAIFISWLFWQVIENRAVQKLWNGLGIALLALLSMGGLALLCLGAVLSGPILMGGVLMLGSSIVAAWHWRRYRGRLSPTVLGGLVLVAIAVPRGFVLPAFEFEPSKRLSTCILAEQPADQAVTVWALGRANYLRQLYTLSQGRIKVRYFKRGALPQDLDHRKLVVLNTRERASLNTPNRYTFETCGATYRTPAIGALWRTLRSGERVQAFQAMQAPLYLARYNVDAK